MPRRGENIYMRKDGRWEGRYIKGRTAEGKQLYGYVYARTYRELKEKLNTRKISAACPLPECSKITSLESTPILFENIMENWLVNIKPQIKESTYVKYRNLMYAHILPELGRLRVDEVDGKQIDVFCRKMLLSGAKNGMGLSPKTVADMLSQIRSAFRYADICGFHLPCDISSITVRQEIKELRILSRKEQEVLCQYLCSNLNGRNLGILISLFTGLRIGELCALEWEDISFAEKTIFVHKTMQRLQTNGMMEQKTKVSISTPKSSCSIRRIPITDGLARILEDYGCAKTGYVLTGRKDIYVEPRATGSTFS